MIKQKIWVIGMMMILVVGLVCAHSIERSFEIGNNEIVVNLNVNVDEEDENYVVEETVPFGIEISDNGDATQNDRTLRWVVTDMTINEIDYIIEVPGGGEYSFVGYYAFNDEGIIYETQGEKELVVCGDVGDCGDERYSGYPYCSGTDVYQTYIVPSACVSGICEYSVEERLLESCSIGCDVGVCEENVGIQATSSSSSSGGGNGGVSSSSSSSSGGGGGVSENCKEDWECTFWKECVEGTKTRTCVDVNNCGTDENKPRERKVCGLNLTIPKKGIGKTTTLIYISILIIIAGGVIYFLIKRKQQV